MFETTWTNEAAHGRIRGLWQKVIRRGVDQGLKPVLLQQSYSTTEVVPLTSNDSLARSAEPGSLLSLAVMALAAGVYCAWVLSLPLFPSQDGPMHLYYVRILQALLFHRDPGIFPQYFTIKHLAPPYALYYYLLLGFGHFVSLVTADKLVVCLYIVLFLFGFRYLARSLGPAGNAVSLLAIPYVLNWPLGMGFVNFCLSIALACWALGLWCRVARQPEAPGSTRRLMLFVALAWVVMFTHPVPLLFALGFCFIDLCVRLLRPRKAGDRALRRDAFAFGLACTTLIYVKAFTTSHVARQIDPIHKTYFEQVRSVAQGIFIFGTVDVFSPHTRLAELRRVSLYLIFLAALAWGGAQAWRSLRRRDWKLADTWFVLAVLLWVAIPILPPDMNNSHLFSSRLMIFAVLAALAGASGAAVPWLRPQSLLAGCAAAAIVLVAVTLVRAQQAIAPVARDIDRLETLPAPPQGVYLALMAPNYAKTDTTLTFDPYWWDQARPVRRGGSILFDTPWLDLAIIPVGARSAMPTGRISSLDLESSYYLRDAINGDASARAIMFPPLTGAIVNYGSGAVPPGLDPALQKDPVPAHHWVCAPMAFTSICEADGKAYNREQ